MKIETALTRIKNHCREYKRRQCAGCKFENVCNEYSIKMYEIAKEMLWVSMEKKDD